MMNHGCQKMRPAAANCYLRVFPRLKGYAAGSYSRDRDGGGARACHEVEG